MDSKILDMDYLRSTGIKPTWFGLGFIQFKLDDMHRLHFWHPAIKGDPVYEAEWHDHRYTFTSEVLRGSIHNQLAYAVPNFDGLYQVHEVCCAGNGSQFSHMADLKMLSSFTTYAGESYTLDADCLHIAKAERCITHQTRATGPFKEKALVVSENYNSPNPFDCTLPESQLWEAMADLIGTKGYHLAPIAKGELGEISKIQEELNELIDASFQNAKVMELVEMSDMIGAMQSYLDKYHEGYKIDDLITMAQITKRAFDNGHRS